MGFFLSGEKYEPDYFCNVVELDGVVEMKLIDDWKVILVKAWSVKFNIASTLFGAAEVVVALVQPASIPNGVFAGIAALISIGANVVRIMAQQEMSNGKT